MSILFFLDSCYEEGREYTKGDEFISEDCSSRCTCNGGDDIVCVDLCPKSNVTCKDDEIVEMKKETFVDSYCACRHPICVKASTSHSLFCIFITIFTTCYLSKDLLSKISLPLSKSS